MKVQKISTKSPSLEQGEIFSTSNNNNNSNRKKPLLFKSPIDTFENSLNAKYLASKKYSKK